MFRAPVALALLLAAALPAAAQDQGGLRRHDPSAMLGQIEANRGCPMANTTVAFATNRAFMPGMGAQQQMAAAGGGCRPLVSTQVVGGVNLALGPGTTANQAVGATGQRGALATTTFTRGANVAYGAGSSANQRLYNQLGR
jgi:hypothetical protein